MDSFIKYASNVYYVPDILLKRKLKTKNQVLEHSKLDFLSSVVKQGINKVTEM